MKFVQGQTSAKRVANKSRYRDCTILVSVQTVSNPYPEIYHGARLANFWNMGKVPD